MFPGGGSAHQAWSWRAPVLLGAIALCLVAVLYASTHPSPWIWSSPRWEVGAPAPAVPSASMPSLSNLSVPGTNLVAIVFGIMLAAVALGLLGLLLYLLGTLLYRVVMALIKARVTARPAPDSLDTAGALSAAGLTPAQLAATTQDALRRLADAVTPRDGVTAAWLAFEDGAAALGLGRDPAQTPTEFTIEVLRHSSAPDKDATTLRRLYSRARFSNLPTTRADIAAAETALRHIADTFDAAHIEAGAHR